MNMGGFLAMTAILGVTLAVGCGPVGGNVNNNGLPGNNNNPFNNNGNTNTVAGLVLFQGTVWSPGADLIDTLEVNRFPIPSAAIIAYHAPPQPLPQQMYCNECVEVPAGTPSTFANPVDGSFSLALLPGQTYWLTVQKGEFRRVRQITMPNTPDQTFTLEVSAGQPRPVETTLPSHSDSGTGDNIPKIAIVDAAYEDMTIMFESLGFPYGDGSDITVLSPGEISSVFSSGTALSAYNLIIAPCGEDWPGGVATAPLKQWVKDGGKLYVDDFNYDFVEQVWPEFLSWYVGEDIFGGGAGPCGTGSTPASGVGTCNNWSTYDFAGDPGDPDFEAWLGLASVNQGAPLQLQAAWDYIYELGAGEVGISETGTGPNGEVYQEPKVWMYNSESTPAGSGLPATVSWPYHCGKVLYTVYHTHSGSDEPYQLLLQEKIMMYLIMEIQTCSTDPIVQ